MPTMDDESENVTAAHNEPTAADGAEDLATAADEENPPAEGEEEGDDEEEEEEATDTIESDGESQPQFSVFGRSQATEDLPVAYEVNSTATPPRPTAQVRRVQQQPQQLDPNIQVAVPQEQVDAEERRAAIRRFFLVSGWILSFAVVVAVVVAVTVGGSSSSGSSGGGDSEPIGPTPSPTSVVFQELQILVKEASLDGGAALEDINSPQYKTLTWLEGNAYIDDYPDWKRIQRYALAVFFFLWNGDDWFNNGGWLSDSDECTWYSQAPESNPPIAVCDETGALSSLFLEKNNINGTIPLELALLSDSLASLNLHLNHLNGTIPTEIGLLTNLGEFWFKLNQLSGTIPTELAMIGRKNVSGVTLSGRGNLLNGTIPIEIARMHGLGVLMDIRVGVTQPRR